MGGFHEDCSRRFFPLPKRKWWRVEKSKHVAGLDGCDSWFIALLLKTQRDVRKYFLPKSEKLKEGLGGGGGGMAFFWPICHIHTEACDQKDGKRAGVTRDNRYFRI